MTPDVNTDQTPPAQQGDFFKVGKLYKLTKPTNFVTNSNLKLDEVRPLVELKEGEILLFLETLIKQSPTTQKTYRLFVFLQPSGQIAWEGFATSSFYGINDIKKFMLHFEQVWHKV